MTLYPYQQCVKSLLQGGKSVILQAPTGAGKTRAALAPFIEAYFDEPDDSFPGQCLYSVPMRALAGQFHREYRHLADRYARVHRRTLDVRIQTGERPEDRELLGDLIFATIDQTLSSALGVPYSLSPGRANLNVGAVIGAYHVFDEFHLFSSEATQTTLQLLRLIGRLSPFLLMTATFSHTMLASIGDLLKAEVVVVPPDEVITIETRQGQQPRKQRRFHVSEEELTAKAVLDTHDWRSLAICNTVDRAIALYEQLCQAGCRPVPVTHPDLSPIYQQLTASARGSWDTTITQGVRILISHLTADAQSKPWVMLLHSRFETPHRQIKEALLQKLWNSQGLEASSAPSLIVVATQVVEVGLDISAQTLHTEIAPAASVLQRAGRCARYPGEQGKVIVYPVPLKEDGQPNYAPYGVSKVEADVCDRSWQAFRERHDAVLDFTAEQEVINQAHCEADAAMLQDMQKGQGELWQRITDALIRGDTSARPQLIRRVDSRTVIVSEEETNPYLCQGISLWHGTLRGKVKILNQLRDELGLDWALRYPVIQETEEGEAIYVWHDVRKPEDIGLSLVFAVHPRLATYDAERGLRLADYDAEHRPLIFDGSYASPVVMARRQRPDYTGYQLESYLQHVANMRRIFEGDARSRHPVADGRLRRRLAWVARRFAEQDGSWQLPPDLLERAVRLAMALHDVGKLSKDWQRFASEYQQAIGEGAPHFLVAHTHYEDDNLLHKTAQQKVRHLKPATHAGESAWAVRKLLYKALEGQTYPGLYCAALAAIARHHSPGLNEAKPYCLHERAVETVAEALVDAGGPNWGEWACQLQISEKAPHLARYLLEAPPDGDWAWWFQYFIIVRILRVCDGLSQEED